MTHRSALPLLTSAAAGLLLGMLPDGAQAQASSPWFARATLVMLQDSNYLRLADGQAAPAGFVKADTTTTGLLAAGYDHRAKGDSTKDPYGPYIEAEVRSSRLANNRRFDNQGWRVVVGLDWRTAGLFSGEMRAVTDRSLTAPETGTTGQPGEANLITLSQADALFRFGGLTGFNAEASVGLRQAEYSASAFDDRDFHEGSASVGVRYRPSDRSSIGLAGRATRGTYPRYQALPGGGFLADDYEGRFVDLTATYVLTGKTGLRARLSSGRTRNENAVQRDFSGLTGSLDWRHIYSPKLTFDLALSREPSKDAFFLTTVNQSQPLQYSRVSTDARLAVRYEPSTHVRVRASLVGTHRELSQTLPSPLGGTVLLTGSDRTAIAGLGLTWRPAGGMLELGCDIGQEVRRGQAPLSADLSSSRVGCKVEVSLERRSLEGRTLEGR